VCLVDYTAAPKKKYEFDETTGGRRLEQAGRKEGRKRVCVETAVISDTVGSK